MGRMRVLAMAASAATLLCGGGNAMSQPVVGGMGEPVQLGAFGTRADNPLARRHVAEKPSAKARRTPNAGGPAAHARQVTPTLPGRHLR